MSPGGTGRDGDAGGGGFRPTRVMIVDDHPIVRDGLRHLIDAERDMEVVAEAKSGEVALRNLAGTEVDLVLVDLALPGMDGITLLRRIRDAHPDLHLVVVSMLDQSLNAERALRAGASGFVTKGDATDEVVTAIRRVSAGDLYVSSGLAMDMIGDLIGGRKGSLSSITDELSEREFEVFRLIGKGMRTSQVADALDLSVKTVETHQANIKRKLGLRDARELAYYAMRWWEMERPDLAGGPINER
jgi:DNA-binding NarL/FixJ family response regulator